MILMYVLPTAAMGTSNTRNGKLSMRLEKVAAAKHLHPSFALLLLEHQRTIAPAINGAPHCWRPYRGIWYKVQGVFFTGTPLKS